MTSQDISQQLDQSRSTVLLLDQNATVKYANKALEYRNGFTPSEAFERNPSDLWGKQMSNDYYRVFWKQINEQNVVFADIQNIHANGTVIKEKLNIIKIPSTKGTYFLELQPDSDLYTFRSQLQNLKATDFGYFQRLFSDLVVPIHHIHSFTAFTESLESIFARLHEDRLEDRAIVEDSLSKKVAIATFYEKYYMVVLRYFYKKVDPITAEELMQDVFLSALKSFQNYHPAASYKTYLLRIAHNRYVDYLRTQKTQVEYADHQRTSQMPLYLIEWAMLQKQIHPEERNLLVKHYLEGYKLKEIAKDLELSENAVKLRLSRLRKKIQGVA